jgi:hypothetical protein
MPRLQAEQTMRKILFPVLALFLFGCNISNDFHVTAFKTVTGDDALPWPIGCLVTVENRTQKVIGLSGVPCEHIQIGDKAVFNQERDTVFWVNDYPYNVHGAQSR